MRAADHKYGLSVSLVVIFILGLTIGVAAKSDKPKAVNGVLDLRSLDLQQNGLIALDGEWEFYWQQLLTPADFRAESSPTHQDLLTVPRAWNKHIVKGEPLPGLI